VHNEFNNITTLETAMLIVKGLAVIGLLSGLFAVMAGENSSGSSSADYVSSTSLPTLFRPMEH
jgi:hypothetical protein